MHLILDLFLTGWEVFILLFLTPICAEWVKLRINSRRNMCISLRSPDHFVNVSLLKTRSDTRLHHHSILIRILILKLRDIVWQGYTGESMTCIWSLIHYLLVYILTSLVEIYISIRRPWPQHIDLWCEFWNGWRFDYYRVFAQAHAGGDTLWDLLGSLPLCFTTWFRFVARCDRCQARLVLGYVQCIIHFIWLLSLEGLLAQITSLCKAFIHHYAFGEHHFVKIGMTLLVASQANFVEASMILLRPINIILSTHIFIKHIALFAPHNMAWIILHIKLISRLEHIINASKIPILNLRYFTVFFKAISFIGSTYIIWTETSGNKVGHLQVCLIWHPMIRANFKWTVHVTLNIESSTCRIIIEILLVLTWTFTHTLFIHIVHKTI